MFRLFFLWTSILAIFTGALLAGSEQMWVGHIDGTILYEDHSYNSTLVRDLPYNTRIEVDSSFFDTMTGVKWSHAVLENASGWIPEKYTSHNDADIDQQSDLFVASHDFFSFVTEEGTIGGLDVVLPLVIEFYSYDRYSGSGEGRISIDNPDILNNGVEVPVLFSNDGWLNSDSTSEPYLDTVYIDPLGLVQELGEETDLPGPVFSFDKEAFTFSIFAGVFREVVVYFEPVDDGYIRIWKLRFTSIDPG